ncbi:hypothetical protein FJT64_004814 [Amphibalanus amphitrite]|uniref:Uncharacterized protein n=1 Tax=Amphibalanus amphitrite TaxID=1232801 RepID=A0A6A4W454_AMPAM|nr:hypothetical protein FJT64_004814 [Amphibalanus amphitrite]
MDTCFEQGFKNARLKFENMDPLHFNTTLKGGSRAVAWEVDGNVSVAGISNYTVKISKAESSDDPHQNRPLTITTAWVAPLWRIELGLTYHLTVIPDVIVIKMAAKVAMALPDVEVLNSLDVWGQQQPDQGLVRFYTEDKNFRIKFDVDTAKIDVTIHKIPTLAHFDALNELVRLHFKHVALDTIWPNIEQKLGTVFKEVVNGNNDADDDHDGSTTRSSVVVGADDKW